MRSRFSGIRVVHVVQLHVITFHVRCCDACCNFCVNVMSARIYFISFFLEIDVSFMFSALIYAYAYSYLNTVYLPGVT